jgi:hypothetical protein
MSMGVRVERVIVVRESDGVGVLVITAWAGKTLLAIAVLD